MRIILILIVFFSIKGIAQTRSYSGFIDRFPIELITYGSSDGNINAIYSYNKYDTPIGINGALKNKNLELYEKDKKGEIIAKLIFGDYDENDNKLFGVWIDSKTNKKLKIILSKDFEFEMYDDTEFKQREMIQSVSTKENYFKLLITKERGEEARVTGVNILKKKTDRLIQKINLDCSLMMLSNISVGDYNFDDKQDFSVFESSYAGPNTSSIYILKNAEDDKYTVSNFSGVSLEFDSESKTIFERNQCCAGLSITTALYKVITNEMVLIEEHCYKWNEEKGERTERPINECK